MNKWILRATAAGLAAALSGAVACSSGSSSGCGGTTDTNTTGTPVNIVTCGPGTYQSGNTCLPLQSTSNTPAVKHL